jgi:exodeoxyribonuclease-3
MKHSIVSYNVNGIRAAQRKGFLEFLGTLKPDVLMAQEVKALKEDVGPELLAPKGYESYWFPAQKKGYSGVATWTKRKPVHVEYGCGHELYDSEGRVLRLDFPEYSVMNVYFPSGTTGDVRQTIKEEFLDFFLPYAKKMAKKLPNLIISGDYNIAHTEQDIHNPVSNKDSSGFLPHERAWVTSFLKSGFVDTYRHLKPEAQEYSWWTYRANARANNKGWRIDYHMVSQALAAKCKDHRIHKDVEQSDHCPIELILDI